MNWTIILSTFTLKLRKLNLSNLQILTVANEEKNIYVFQFLFGFGFRFATI